MTMPTRRKLSGVSPAMKVYRCPSCGAAIALQDINVAADTMLCRSCGKVHPCSRAVRREEVRGELGKPPPGVKVTTGIAHPDVPCEDRIVYSRRNMAMIMLCLFWSGVSGCGAASLLYYHDWLPGFIVCGLCALGLTGLVFEVFGKNTLRLFRSGGIYTAGVFGVRRQARFDVSGDTDAYVDEYPNQGLINQGQQIREVAVAAGKWTEVRFARWLPRDVQEFFCRCIARHVAGVPLKDMDGGRFGSRVGHPFAFAVILAAAAACFAYAFSGRERIVVDGGTLTIEESKWWGCETAVSRIPVKDITYIDFRSCGRSSWDLYILGKDRRLIRRLEGYGRDVSRYQIGLMEAIRCQAGTKFDKSRFTNMFFLALGFFLLLPAAFACGGFEIAAATGNALGSRHCEI